MEYDFDIEYPMQSLYIAKAFHEHGLLDRLLENLDDDISLSWDELPLIEHAALECAFEDCRYYYQRERRVGRDEYEPDHETYVMRDPLLTRYDDLCRRLEMKLGITKVENRFVMELESAIHRNMQFDSYSYEYYWIDSTKDRKGAKIVLLLFEEFAAYYDIPDSLLSILDFCKEGIPKLEAALAEASEEKVIPLPVKYAPEKEAA